MAMIARRLGFTVLLLERGRHPRVVIGESSTPLSNLLLEELSARYDLPAVKPLSKWGSWQQSYPDLACGLKRGFTFYHHTLGVENDVIHDRKNQLLVAASPHDAIADTHWYRADFDHFLVREAQQLGVAYLDEIILNSFVENDTHVILQGHHQTKPMQFHAKFVVDATGPRGFLHQVLRLGEKGLPDLPPTQALFSHFRGVKRLEEISSASEPPPYPI